MEDRSSPLDNATPAAEQRGNLTKAVRYGTGSIIATVCSEVAFLALYGLADASTTWASAVAWLAGAIPNYVLNRTWAWGLRGRPSMRREVLPYLTIVILTLGVAIVMTGLADRIVDSLNVSDPGRTLIVGAVFLGVYAAVFILRFFLFDRLFSGQPGQEPSATLRGMSGDGHE